MPTKVGDKLRKRYEIKEILGHGEHGKTWKAWDTGSAPPKFCVIKEPIGSRAAIKELEAESAAAGLLHHKNIVPVLEFNGDDGFLVEEFVPGNSLQGRLRDAMGKSTWPSIEEALSLVTQCLEGLEYAHEKGRVHGDVKPANIMLPEVGEARLTHFGVSRFVSGTSTSGGAPWDPSRFGSATYAAPEVLSERHWSFQSDLFSMGILAYLLFTKKHPFVDVTGLWPTKDRILASEVVPTPISTLVETIGPRIERVTKRLLERDPDMRYQSAREALDDLIGQKPLTNACQTCGQDNPLTARFCSNCGKQIVEVETPRTENEELYRRAFSLFSAGEITKAIEAFESLVAQHPTYGKAWAQLAFLLNHIRKYDEAILASNRAIAIAPNFPGPYRTKGFALSSLGKFDEAIQQFDLALEKERNTRDRSQILTQRAYSLMLAGKKKEAEEGALFALEEDSSNFQARNLLYRLRATGA